MDFAGPTTESKPIPGNVRAAMATVNLLHARVELASGGLTRHASATMATGINLETAVEGGKSREE
jgi:hypothetical protein